MAEAISEAISFIRSRLENRRFGDETLRILESVLVARDVQSLVEIRSALRELLRSEAMAVIGEISEKTVDWKLCVADFFVKAFALVGDVESCLALRHEALVLRELICHGSCSLRVSYEEWFCLAKDSLENGFYANAVKGFESALLCLQSDQRIDSESAVALVKEHTINDIRRLKEMSTALIASNSVQTQSAEYIKRKENQENQENQELSTSLVNSNKIASLFFRYGIKKRNRQKLHKSRVLARGS